MQGDIFSFAPAASVRDDIDLLVATNLSGARSVFARYRLDLRAKAIDQLVDFGNRQTRNFDFSELLVGSINYRFSHALLLTHSCDIENEEFRTLALVRPMADLSSESDIDTIRGNHNYNYYYLPDNPPILSEGYVDFRAITTIRKAVLDNCERVISLSDEALRGLYGQLFLCMTHSTVDSKFLNDLEIEQ